MIPKVRQWKVTTYYGSVWIILAPTKLLARLNFQHYVGHTEIKSIGLVRRNRIMPDGIQMAWKEI